MDKLSGGVKTGEKAPSRIYNVKEDIIAWEARKKDSKYSTDKNFKERVDDNLKALKLLRDKQGLVQHDSQKKLVDVTMTVNGDNTAYSVGEKEFIITKISDGRGTAYDYLHGTISNDLNEIFTGREPMKAILADVQDQVSTKRAFRTLVNTFKSAKSNPQSLMNFVNDFGNLLVEVTSEDANNDALEGTPLGQFGKMLKTNDSFAGGVYTRGEIPGLKLTDMSVIIATALYHAGVKVKLVDGAQLFGSREMQSERGHNASVMIELGDGMYGWNMGNEGFVIEGVDNMSDAMKIINRKAGTTAVHTMQNFTTHDSGKTFSEVAILDETYYLKSVNGTRQELSVDKLTGYKKIKANIDKTLTSISSKMGTTVSLSSKPVVDILTGRNQTHTAEITLNFTNGKAAKILIDDTSSQKGVELLFSQLDNSTSTSIKIGYAETETEGTMMYDKSNFQELNAEFDYTRKWGNGKVFAVGLEGTVGEGTGTTQTISNWYGEYDKHSKQSDHKFAGGNLDLTLGQEFSFPGSSDEHLVFVTGGANVVLAQSDHTRISSTDGVLVSHKDVKTGFLEQYAGLGLSGDMKGLEYHAEFDWIRQLGKESAASSKMKWQYGHKGKLQVRKRFTDEKGNYEIEVKINGTFKRVPEVMFAKGAIVGINGEFNKKGRFSPYFSAEYLMESGHNLAGKINESMFNMKAGIKIKPKGRGVFDFSLSQSSDGNELNYYLGYKFNF